MHIHITYINVYIYGGSFRFIIFFTQKIQKIMKIENKNKDYARSTIPSVVGIVVVIVVHVVVVLVIVFPLRTRTFIIDARSVAQKR